jgi:hypothetical protein
VNVDSLVQTGRRLAADGLLDVGIIYKHTSVSDGRGGWVDVYAMRPGTQACRLVGVKDQLLQNIAEVLSGPSTVILLLPYGTNFEDQDQIFVNGVLYQAAGEISAESVTTVLKRVVVREM